MTDAVAIHYQHVRILFTGWPARLASLTACAMALTFLIFR